MIRDPLCMLDMDVPVDGADAFVLTTTERRRDLTPIPVVDPRGDRRACRHRTTRTSCPSLARHGQHVVVEALKAKSDLWLDDVDVFFPYDGFSIITLGWIENVGYCEPGEAGRFMQEHWDEAASGMLIDGRVPMNPHGGSLSEGASRGTGHLREAVTQLRGDAGERQVPRRDDRADRLRRVLLQLPGRDPPAAVSEHRFYGELAEWWPLVSPPEDYAEEAAEYARLLAAHPRPVVEVLELGSGGGHNAVHLRAHFTLTLVDQSASMIEQSRRLNPGCEHHVGDMRAIRLDRAFDAVFIHDAIDYLTTEDDLAAASGNRRRPLPTGRDGAVRPGSHRGGLRPRQRPRRHRRTRRSGDPLPGVELGPRPDRHRASARCTPS